MQKPRRALSLLSVVIAISLGLTHTPAVSAYEWGVDGATSPSADWQPLSAGESPWYAFDYAGDGSEIQVKLQAIPTGSTRFVVWTPGPVVAGEIGDYKREITYLGDTVNTGARIQQACRDLDRQILVSDALVKAANVPAVLHLEDMGSVSLRGKAESVALFALHI